MRYLIVILLNLLLNNIFAQHSYEFEQFSVEDGMSGSSVMAICRDHKGFMWFGTYTGLSKYDGYQFEQYYYRPNDSASISYDNINDIFEDSKKVLWVATREGLNRYNRKSNTFKRYYHSRRKGTISNSFVQTIFEDSDSLLWFGTFDGLDHYNRETNQFTNFKPFKSNTSKNWVMSIVEDHDGNLWIGTYKGGIHLFNRKDSSFVSFLHDESNPFSISGNSVRDMAKDNFGNIWVGTLEGLNIFDKVRLQFLHEKNTPRFFGDLSDNRILSLASPNHNEIWIGTMAGGLNIYDRSIDSITTIKEKDNSKKEKLSRNSIVRIYDDKHGNIWLGTDGGGVNYYNKGMTAFKSIGQSASDVNDLENEHIRTIYPQGEKHLLLGTEDGLSFFDMEHFSFENYQYAIPEKDGLNLQVTAIEQIDDGQLWLGSNDGLYSFDPKSKSFNKIAFIPDDFVFTVKRSDQGEIWIGTNMHGLYCYDTEKESYKHYIQYKDNLDTNKGLQSNEVLYIYQENKNTLWIGCRGGLDKLDIEKEEFTHYPYQYGLSGLSDENVRVIIKGSEGMLWIATLNGLNAFNPETGQWKKYFISDGLPSNNIKGLVEDHKNRLWVSTENGLSCFLRAQNRFINFNEEDGLPSYNFHRNASGKFRDHQVAFGSDNGFVLFYPDSVDFSPVVNTIVVTRFKVLKGKAGHAEQIYDFSDICLPYHKSSFTIEFSSLNYTAREKVRYAASLSGLEDEWSTLGKERSVTYLRLKPGIYTFKVRAYDRNYPEKYKEMSVPITILPPFWMTWWFRIAIVLFIVSLMVGFYFYRIKKIRKDKEKLEHIVRMRTNEITEQKEEISIQADELRQLNATKDRFFSVLAHDLKNPFQAIRNNTDVLLRQYDTLNEDQKLENIRAISKTAENTFILLENLLQWSRSQINSLSFTPVYFKIAEPVNDTIKLIQPLADKKQVIFFIDIPDDLVIYADKQMISTILRNLLNNAVKFSYPKQEVTISAWLTDDTVHVKVVDKGTGMDQNTLNNLFRIDKYISKEGTGGEKGTGLGLILCKEFIEKMNGDISIKSKTGQGTSISFSLHAKEAFSDYDEKARPTSRRLITEIEKEEDKNKYLVLIIDDDSTLRSSLANILNPVYRVKQADNGNEGLIKAVNFLPDLIISDVKMPVMDGIELSRKIKQDKRTSHIPLILLTGKDEDQAKLEGLETGADEYITKPYEPGYLLRKIHNLINIRNQLKEKFRTNIDIVPEDISLNNTEEELLNNVLENIEKNMDNVNFNVDLLSREMNMSRSLLYVKIKAVTGQTVNEFIRSVKLKRAAKIIKESDLSINEIAAMTGFKNQSHFSKAFNHFFGISPVKYRRS